jgi:ribosomal protein S8
MSLQSTDPIADLLTRIRNAVMVGKNALSYASMFGKSLSEAAMVKFYEQTYDHGYFVSDEARMIYGVKKMTPSNKQDIGVIVISTYAAAHTA